MFCSIKKSSSPFFEKNFCFSIFGKIIKTALDEINDTLTVLQQEFKPHYGILLIKYCPKLFNFAAVQRRIEKLCK